METQWTVEAKGDNAAPLTVTMQVQVAQVTIATENGDQIVVPAEQLEPLVSRLDSLNYYLIYGGK